MNCLCHHPWPLLIQSWMLGACVVGSAEVRGSGSFLLTPPVLILAQHRWDMGWGKHDRAQSEQKAALKSCLCQTGPPSVLTQLWQTELSGSQSAAAVWDQSYASAHALAHF